MRFKWLHLCALVLRLFSIPAAAETSQPSLDPPPLPKSRTFPQQESHFYSIILDVGSTGTRAYVFVYEHNEGSCGTSDGSITLFMPGWSKKIRPGLTKVWEEQIRPLAQRKDQLATLVAHFQPLREFAQDALDDAQFQKTSFMVHATGGFRTLLDLNTQSYLLDLIHETFRTAWPGSETSKQRHQFRVLSGAEEGAYSWLAVNQLARRFYGGDEHVRLHPQLQSAGSPDPLPGAWFPDNWDAVARGEAGRRQKKRVGLIEVGGASAQIAVEPSERRRKELLAQAKRTSVEPLQPHPVGGDVHVLRFCGSDFILQIRGLDGLGREAAFERFLRFLALKEDGSISRPRIQVECLAEDVAIPIVLAAQTVYAEGVSGGTASNCRKLIREFLADSGLRKISFELDPDYRIYATENFYYYNQYVAQANASLFSTQEFLNSAQRICNMSALQDVRNSVHHEIAEEKIQTACFGLIFLSEFVENSVSVAPDQLLKAVTSIKNLETSYTVGSLLLELPQLHTSLFLKSSTSHADEL